MQSRPMIIGDAEELVFWVQVDDVVCAHAPAAITEIRRFADDEVSDLELAEPVRRVPMRLDPERSQREGTEWWTECDAGDEGALEFFRVEFAARVR